VGEWKAGCRNRNTDPTPKRESGSAGTLLPAPQGPVFDFVFTMSDTTSREALPEWPGRPASAHWRYADPTKTSGEEWERQRQFARTLSGVERQMRIFMMALVCCT
jgi:protein-tyrosine-phosphatase